MVITNFESLNVNEIPNLESLRHDMVLRQERFDLVQKHLDELCLECGKPFGLTSQRRRTVEYLCSHIKCRECYASRFNDAGCSQCSPLRVTRTDFVNENESNTLLELGENSNHTENVPANSETTMYHNVYIIGNCLVQPYNAEAILANPELVQQLKCNGIDVDSSVEEFVVPFYPGDYIQYDTACLLSGVDNLPIVAEEIVIEPEHEDNNTLVFGSPSKQILQSCINSTNEQIILESLLGKRNELQSETLRGVETKKLTRPKKCCKKGSGTNSRPAFSVNQKNTNVSEKGSRPLNRFLENSPEKVDSLKQPNVLRNQEQINQEINSLLDMQSNIQDDILFNHQSPHRLLCDTVCETERVCTIASTNFNDTMSKSSKPKRVRSKQLFLNSSTESSLDPKRKNIDPSTMLISRTTFKPEIHDNTGDSANSSESNIKSNLHLTFHEANDIAVSEYPTIIFPDVDTEDLEVQIATKKSCTEEALKQFELETAITSIQSDKIETNACVSINNGSVDLDNYIRTLIGASEISDPLLGTSSSIFKTALVNQAHNDNTVIPAYIVVLNNGNKIIYRCEICKKTFKTKAHISYHEFCVQGGERERPFKCHECGKGFIAKSHYIYHLRSHTGERPHVCLVCGKGFRAAGKLTRHMQIHSGKLPAICGECGREFATCHALKCHEQVHSAERPYSCDYCPMRFKGLANVRKHVLVHTGERPFKCDQCERAFGMRWTLEMHMKIHTNVRPYTCEQCSRTFSNRKDLTRHQTVHSSLKPFKCPNCEVTFRRKDNLDRHVKTMHPS